MPKKKLLIICNRLYPQAIGGVERYIYEQAQALKHYQVKLLTQRSNISIPGHLDVAYFGRISISRYLSRTFDSVLHAGKEIKQLVNKFSPDLIFLHHVISAYSFYKLRIKIPSVYFFHGSFYSELALEANRKRIFRSAFRSYIKRIEQFVLLAAPKIIVLSEFSRQLLLKNYPQVSAKKIFLVPGGIDLKQFHPIADKNKCKQALKLPTHKTIFLTVRRLVPRMGLMNLLQAVSLLNMERQDWLLLIIGKGPELKKLEDICARLGLLKQVRFLGFIPTEKLVIYYQAADLFILPSLAFEGFGLVTGEALACATPVMGTPIGATPEILSALHKKALFKDTSPKAIYAGLADYLKNPALYQKFGIIGADLVKTKYAWPEVIKQYENITNQ